MRMKGWPVAAVLIILAAAATGPERLGPYDHCPADESGSDATANFLEPPRKLFPGVEVIPIADLDINSSALRKSNP